jgi:Protein of unknown function (DUF1553)/Protein of unknown function (DUF1549)
MAKIGKASPLSRILILATALNLSGPRIDVAVTVKALRIEPQGIVLPNSGASQRFIVTAVSADGTETDVTRLRRVNVSNPEVVRVDTAKGLLFGSSPGRARLRISQGKATTGAEIAVGSRPAEMAVNFSPDILSILTTKGCNGSGCHGSPAGQNGFKLSLFGYDSTADHQMIVRGHGGRRINLQDPAKSLLLLKPTFAEPHGGGRLLTEDSDEYRTLLKWIQQGAPLSSSGVRLAKLEIYPAERILVGAGTGQPVVVIGRLSDGTTRDMTREVRYVVGDDTVIRVTPEGMLTSQAPGMTSVMARALGQVATAQIGVVQQAAGPDYPPLKGNNFIDELVLAKLRRMNVRPAPLSSDREFIRRVYLDSIGTLPTPEELHRFLKDSRPDKRSRLIDSLLERPEYVSHWTVKFEDWFRNCQLHMQGRSMGAFKDWIRGWVAADQPYNQVVRQLLTSQGDTLLNPAANFWHPATDFMLKQFSVNKITPTVTRLFLGVRMECAECHNHPLENFTQDDFYGLAAFFARLRVKHGYGEYRRTWFLEKEGEVEHPVTKKPVSPRLLGGPAPQIPESVDRRAVLADWVVSPGNPYFARATVNRIWHEYFDTGIVEPFDDFRSTNMPTNPELLDRLAQHFIDRGCRLKDLHRVILRSRTYQASCESPPAPDAGQSAQVERLLFARYFPRKLPAEVLLDSVSQVTGVAHQFQGYPKGTSAKDLYSPDAPDYFLVTFGFPRRDVLAERSKSPSLSQALHMMNGKSVGEKIQSDQNILTELLSRGLSDTEVIAEIYERVYSRLPGETELGSVLENFRAERAVGRNPRQVQENFLWAVLNSKEFQLNH